MSKRAAAEKDVEAEAKKARPAAKAVNVLMVLQPLSLAVAVPCCWRPGNGWSNSGSRASSALCAFMSICVLLTRHLVPQVGTGEYTSGYTPPKSADDVSDKGAGVVGLVMMDLRAKGKTDRLAMVGVNGRKFPAIRKHMQKNIGDVYVPAHACLCAVT
jgi:hypothetical protein